MRLRLVHGCEIRAVGLPVWPRKRPAFKRRPSVQGWRMGYSLPARLGLFQEIRGAFPVPCVSLGGKDVVLGSVQDLAIG